MTEAAATKVRSNYKRYLSSISYDERVKLAAEIAEPMASEKLAENLRTLIEEARTKKMLDYGAKACFKRLRKKEGGILIIPGDVSPIDSVTHLQGFCLEEKRPYCYVPTRFDLGETFIYKVSVNCVYIRCDESYKRLYNACLKDVKKLPEP
ncbi:hypothetical protein Aperf_G00000067295 [Anoplocephala perfoliata]